MRPEASLWRWTGSLGRTPAPYFTPDGRTDLAIAQQAIDAVATELGVAPLAARDLSVAGNLNESRFSRVDNRVEPAASLEALADLVYRAVGKRRDIEVLGYPTRVDR